MSVLCSCAAAVSRASTASGPQPAFARSALVSWTIWSVLVAPAGGAAGGAVVAGGFGGADVAGGFGGADVGGVDVGGMAGAALVLAGCADGTPPASGVVGVIVVALGEAVAEPDAAGSDTAAPGAAPNDGAQ